MISSNIFKKNFFLKTLYPKKNCVVFDEICKTAFKETTRARPGGLALVVFGVLLMVVGWSMVRRGRRR